ncbi:MAG: GtrA family protein [Novosphingobium sp.]|uniref:GtrA family protein n=1 Tax=Novosphingobium sp. TaxID=1874826 RepID=UPI0032B9C93B
MANLLEKLRDSRFLRYFAASCIALAIDLGSFFLLLKTPLAPGLSAAIAYSLGIVAIWVLLSRAVFTDGTHGSGPARTQQKALFLVSSWGGLALTTAIVSAADLIQADVRLFKGLAVIFSFAFNYFARKHLVFTAHRKVA